MTVLASRSIAPPSRPSSWRHLLAWHPEWWVYVVSAAAWLGLVVIGVSGAISMSMPLAEHVPGPVGGLDTWWDRWTHWLLMVPAMMLPVVAARVRAVGLRSVWSRRHLSAGLYVLGFLAVWAVVGAALVAVVVAAGLDHDAGDLLVVSLLLAAAWQGSPARRRLVRRCAPLRLGAPTGLAADADCLRAGARSAQRCMLECWPVMLAMALSHSLLLMVGLTVVLLTERARGANPQLRAGRHQEAWVLAGFAGVALLALAAG
jgi:hypothetical protein